MDFHTFKKVASILPADVSVLLRGLHGTGKSSIVRQMSKEYFNLPIIERRLSQMSEGDLIGLPKLTETSTIFHPPEWFFQATQQPYMIFLDEFDRANKQLQQEAMELILDRSVFGKKIHNECRIYAAINGGKYGSRYNVIPIDIAILDRFWIADIEPSIREWLEWGRKENSIIPEILDFISINNEFLDPKELKDIHSISPSRRSWERLSNVLRDNKDIITNINTSNDIFISLCIGFIGASATSVFKDFLLERENYISADDILNNFFLHKERVKRFNISQLNLIIDKIEKNTIDPKIEKWNKKQAKNIEEFFSILPAELQLSLWTKISQSESKIENAKILSKYASDLIVGII